MNNGRTGHTSSILTNESVLVTGGYNGRGGYINSTELYNVSTGTWTITGCINNARY